MTATLNGQVVYAPRERDERVVVAYQSGETLETIGKIEGVTRERVRQLVERWEREHGLTRGTVLRERRRAVIEQEIGKEERRDVDRAEVKAHRIEGLLEQLRQFKAAHGRLPTAAELGGVQGEPRAPDCPLGTALIVAFRTMNKAIRAAGLFDDRPHQRKSHRHSQFTESTAFGAWLRELRANKDWSGRKLAERAGISDAMLFNYERGDTEPSLRLLRKIMAALGSNLTEAVQAYESFFVEETVSE